MKRILYVGQLDPGGTCLDRLNSLKRLGHDVIGFNISKYQSPHRIIRSMQWRFQPKITLKALNATLLDFANKLNGIDLVWIDKGIWIFPETLGKLKSFCSAELVHYTPDPQILFHKSKHFIASINVYDHLITTKSFEVGLYKQYGSKNLIVSQQSYCPVRYSNPVPDSRYQCDIGFIGHYENHYGNALSALSKIKSKMNIHGKKWKSNAWKHSGISGAVCSSGLWSEDYVNAVASFQIGVGLISKWIPEQHTTRSFEIPAAGTFLLAERTPEHLGFFEEGIEAEFFSTNEELVDKARFYLANNPARERIAMAGKARCMRSGYDNDSIIGNVLKEIEHGHN